MQRFRLVRISVNHSEWGGPRMLYSLLLPLRISQRRHDENMAAKEIVNSSTNEVEPVVNRWLMDYYFSLALEFFHKEQYADFLGIRHVLDSEYQTTCSFSTFKITLSFNSALVNVNSSKCFYQTVAFTVYQLS